MKLQFPYFLGYNAGYRSSWGCTTGRVTAPVFEDNTKAWSEDHCVDPGLVRGGVFSNRRINTKTPDIKGFAHTTLNLLGVDIPEFMKRKPLIEACKKEFPYAK